MKQTVADEHSSPGGAPAFGDHSRSTEGLSSGSFHSTGLLVLRPALWNHGPDWRSSSYGRGDTRLYVYNTSHYQTECINTLRARRESDDSNYSTHPVRVLNLLYAMMDPQIWPPSPPNLSTKMYIINVKLVSIYIAQISSIQYSNVLFNVLIYF